LSGFERFVKGVGIDPLVARKAIPKHKGILSEELLISGGGYVAVLIWVHDQRWRYYVYRVHVMASRGRSKL